VLQDKVRSLERENSEMKAAKLMTMFNGGAGALGSSLGVAAGLMSKGGGSAG